MKILVINPFGIGDVLFMTPLIKALRKELRIEYIDAILGSRGMQVLGQSPLIDKAFLYDRGIWEKKGAIRAWFEKRRMYKQLQQRAYDVLIDCSSRKEYGKWLRGLRIKKRIGFDYKGRGKHLTHRLPVPDEGFLHMHAADYYSRLGEYLGVAVSDKQFECVVPDAAEREACALAGHYGVGAQSKVIVIVPGSGSSWGKDAFLKQWPVEHFIALVKKIEHEHPFDAVFVLGSADEAGLGEKLCAGLGAKAVNLCGKTTLSVSAALTRRAALFIGNDGGMVHIASSFGVPLIALYGPVDARQYGPYPGGENTVAMYKEGLACRPCYKGFSYASTCVSRDCLTKLSADEVYARVRQSGVLKNLG